jgi:2-polyprenyl-3-methyl-5-hydroxy-6-metoxy-1,4-benzoquinol methylase
VGHKLRVYQKAVGRSDSARKSQLSFYRDECEPEFEISRPQGCGRLYEFLIEHKFRTGLRLLDLDIGGRSLLEVCCGSGMMAEKFASAGALVTGIDLSFPAIARARERAQRNCFAAQFLAGDAERLAFADHSFDVVAVHDGLHHLANPERAIGEMARVARHGVLILEPARAALTRLAVWVGIAVDVEDAGNEVKRMMPARIAAMLRSYGYCKARWERTLMYYPHQPFRWFRWFDHPLLFKSSQLLFSAINLAFGRWGNKLALSATMGAPMSTSRLSSAAPVPSAHKRTADVNLFPRVCQIPPTGRSLKRQNSL